MSMTKEKEKKKQRKILKERAYVYMRTFDYFFLHNNTVTAVNLPLDEWNQLRLRSARARYQSSLDASSRKHAYIILTPLNPTSI